MKIVLTGSISNVGKPLAAEFVKIDKYSQNIIISQIETLLNYSERFYNLQFLTRKKANHRLLERLEEKFTDYFNSDELISRGLPSV